METIITLNNDNEEDDQSIKPLLQFRSVSKQWLSLISSPSFPKLHQHRSTSLLITAYDTSTWHRHILSVPRAIETTESPRVTHLMTLHDALFTHPENTELEHLHGLVLLTIDNGYIENDFALVINPSTRKYVNLNAPDSVSVYDHGKVHACYFFGYDEFEHSLGIIAGERIPHEASPASIPQRHVAGKTYPQRHVAGESPDMSPGKQAIVVVSVEIMLYELSSFTWRKIDVDLPFDISDGARQGRNQGSRNEVLVFDLRREVFEIIKIPNEVLPIEYSSCYDCKGTRTLKFNQPFFMKVNGFLGVVCHDRVVTSNEMDIWMLKDYEERVWVKKTIVFGESWVDLEGPFPLDCVNVDEIAFVPKSVSKDLIMLALPYEVPTLGVVAYGVVVWTRKKKGANRDQHSRDQRARSGGLWSGDLDPKRGANRDQHSRDQRGR
ncbi:putative F-box domain-containing protein [Tanacetum coccineum]